MIDGVALWTVRPDLDGAAFFGSLVDRFAWIAVQPAYRRMRWPGGTAPLPPAVLGTDERSCQESGAAVVGL